MCDCHFEFEWEVEFPPFHFEFSGCKRCVSVTLEFEGKLSFLHSILSLRCVSVTLSSKGKLSFLHSILSFLCVNCHFEFQVKLSFLHSILSFLGVKDV